MNTESISFDMMSGNGELSPVDFRDIEMNFWEAYPVFKLTEPFKKFYGKDRTAKKARSSEWMWAFFLAFVNDNLNPFKLMSLEQRKKKIKDDLLQDDKFSWDAEPDVVEAIQQMCLSPLRRHANTMREVLSRREQFLLDQSEKLDLKMIKDFDTLFANSDKILDMVERAEKKANLVMNNKVDNLSESQSGDI